MIFDSHAHYDDEAFDEDRFEVLAEVYNSGVTRLTNVASSIETSRVCVDLANKYYWIYASVGVHPEFADTVNEDSIETIINLSKNKKCVAIGEIGLDYYWDDCPRSVQQIAFRKQLQLSVDLDLPVIIHDRDAHGDCLSALKEFGGRVKGIMHCFSGSKEFAEEILKLGLYVSFSGSVTFKNAKNLSEAASVIPDDKILIETDCPYLAPVPHRGERNSSLFIHETARFLANLRNVGFDEFCQQTYKNASTVFNIK